MVYSDYLLQLTLLLLDPIYRGHNLSPGADRPLLLIPGFLVGDWSLRVMAGWLRRIGYRPYLSGIAWNVYAPERTSVLLTLRLTYIVEETHSPVILVGHSLGGVLARFLSVSAPQYVRHVVTIGSPLSNTPHAVHPMIRGAFLFLHRLRNPRGRISPAQSHFAATVSAPLPPSVEGTTIFSRNDEIVDWRACIDPRGTNYQVPGRHLGLVVNRTVYRLLATILSSSP